MAIKGKFSKSLNHESSPFFCMRFIIKNNVLRLHFLFSAALFFLFPFIVCAQAPVADFSSDAVSGCKPIVIKFSDLSTNNPTGWSWDLGNGSTSPAQNPTTTYLEAGTYTVKLIATNADGSNTIIKTNYITVYDLPQIDFSSNNTVGCAPLASGFTDKSVTAGSALTQWAWAFGDGEISNEPNPLHTYATAGTYNVSLKATDSRGCSDVAFKPQYVKAGGSFNSDFSSSISPYCGAPVTVSFSNLSNGTDSLSFAWDFGDGTASSEGYPTHNYNSFGDFPVSLIGVSTSGCSDTITKIVKIPVKLVDFSGPQLACAGLPVSFTVTSDPQPLFVTWKMGDGTLYNTTTISHVYAQPGTYIITLINDFGGCVDSTSKSITVTTAAQAEFAAFDSASCIAPFTASFKNQTQNSVSQTWDFGDLNTSGAKNPVHIYRTEGNFNVTLQVTDSSGCISTVTKNAYIKIIKPAIKLKLPVSGCAPFYFTPTVTIAHADPIISYLWSFGNGQTSTDSLPSYIYTTPGSYTVSLIIETQGGCRDTASVTNGVRVSANTSNTFDFTFSPAVVCVNKNVYFTSDATGPNLAYKWYFGDNVSSGQKDAVHSYTDTGTYTLRLDVSFTGCTSSVVKMNAVKVIGPSSKFTFKKDCADRGRVYFSDTSKNATSLQWDFGDGSTSTDPDPVHKYTASGNYTVRLIATNGCSDTSQQVIPVWLEGISIASDKNSVCKGDPIVFTVTHPSPASVLSYSFNFSGNFSDGFINSSTNIVSWVYRANGNFKVTVVTLDKFGCRDTAVLPTLINVHGPTAKFGIVKNFQCAGQATEFIDTSSSNGPSSITKWTWYYGDGTIQDYTAPPFSHVYSLAGRFSVGLKVEDEFGCTDSLTQPDFVTSYYAAADFSSIDSFSCPGKAVRFTDRSTGPVFGRLWDFGDGAISTDANPLHSYTAIGTYTIKLTIFSAGGCADSIKKTNYVSIGYPSAHFSLSDSIASCPPLQVSFTDSSQYVSSYVWNLGDGSISTVQNPAANYFLPGKYDVKLIVTSPGGCKDSAFASIRVAGPNGIISYSPTTGCIPVPANFKVATTGAIAFTWDFGDGFTTSSTDSSSAHTYTSGGKFLPLVLIKNPQGCTVPIKGTDTVFIEKLMPSFAADKTTVCDTASVYFTDSTKSTGALTYQWYFGDGATSTEKNPIHSYASAGKYSVKLFVTSSLGCSDSVTYTNFIDVFKLPQPSIIAPAEACEGAVLFTSQVVPDPLAPVVDYTWTFGNNDSSKLSNPPQQTFEAGTYTNSLTVTNSKGCAATVSKSLLINPLPMLTLPEDTTICKSDTVRLQVSGAAAYNWSVAPPGSLSCTACGNPLIYPSQLSLYSVSGTSAAGCVSKGSVRVDVLLPFSIEAVAAYDICRGENVQINASGAPMYLWLPPGGLSSTTIPNPVAKPLNTTTYTVVGYDSLGCFTDTANVLVKVNSLPTVDAGNDITIAAGSKILAAPVISANVIRYAWSPADNLSCGDCATPEITATKNLTYRLVVTSDSGCTANDTLHVFVTCGNSSLYVPNTFSPNNDGSNDVFFVRAKGISTVHFFKILSRTGETMFEKRYFSPNDITAGWDGTYKGQSMETGVYIYFLEVICSNNQILKYSGNVTLIR